MVEGKVQKLAEATIARRAQFDDGYGERPVDVTQMDAPEIELEARLNALPDADEFTWCMMFMIERYGIVDEVLQMLKDTPDATLRTVNEFECVYDGTIELFDDVTGRRVPVGPERLRMTRGMRAMLAGLKGKTLRSFELAPQVGAPVGARVADRNVRVNTGGAGVEVTCHHAAVALGAAAPELGVLLCCEKGRGDEFVPKTGEHGREYMVGERVTGVELVTEAAALGPGPGGGTLAADSAVVLRTALGAHVVARESWGSSRIAVLSGERAAMPYTEEECAEELGRLLGGKVEGVARTVEKLA